MNTVLNIVIVVLMCAGALIPAKRALHMFQQNRYETGRYSEWIRENFSRLAKQNLFSSILMVLVFICGILLNHTAGQFIACAALIILILLMYASEKKQNYIKPLVYTGRVKRQIAVLSILYVLWICALIPWEGLISLSYFGAFLMPWLLIYLVGAVTSPIEAAVRKSYLNDAKKILESHSNLIKIGITGSFGKTTTKNIMQAMVSEQFNSLMTPASYNTPMGITRTIREMLKPIHQVFVCEMGADHVGDITELMNFVHPSIGVVTSIGPQHLNTFGSQENITREKMQMIEMLPADGFGVLNYDNDAELAVFRKLTVSSHLPIDEDIPVYLLPTQKSSDLFARMINGYFNDDLQPRQNYALIQHFTQNYGYTLMGMGATTLLFIRETNPDRTIGSSILEDLSRLYSIPSDKMKKVGELIAVNKFLVLPYTESLMGLPIDPHA